MGLRATLRHMRRPAVTALVAATVATVAAACGSSSSGGDNKHVTYWSMYKVGEPAQKVLAAAISDFEHKTGIKVDAQWQGRNNMTKLQPALNTSSVPDLVDASYVKMYPVLIATHQALGLDQAYSEKIDGGSTAGKLIPDRYLKNIDIQYDNGQKWMLPYTLTSDGIWFDAAKYAQLQAAPPQNWDQFISELNTLKAQGGRAPIALDGDIAGYNAFWFDTLMMRNLGPGSLMKLASDKTGSAWDNPAVLDAAKRVEQLVKGGYFIHGYNASKWPAQQQAWANGKAALLFMGSWAPTETAPYAASGFQYASFPFPQTNASVPTSARADFIGFAVPKKAKNPKAAQQLAAFVLGKKYEQEFGAQAKLLPVRSDVSVSPELSGVKKSLDEAKETYQQNDGVAFPGYNEKVFWPVDDKLVLGEISAEKFVSTMKAATVRYWESQN